MCADKYKALYGRCNVFVSVVQLHHLPIDLRVFILFFSCKSYNKLLCHLDNLLVQVAQCYRGKYSSDKTAVFSSVASYFSFVLLNFLRCLKNGCFY